MCGIAGCISHHNNISDVDHVEYMSRRIQHRGPDASGLYVSDNYSVVFAHRRLSILDTTDAGAQPFISSDGKYVLVYNGEIYNYLELRKSIEKEGYQFSSNSDTEVLLAAYIVWGLSFIERLRGMFAFALYDRRTGKVIIGRDRLGIKPIYLSVGQNRLWFCSELDPLREVAGLNQLSRISIAGFLRYRCIHGSKTIWEGAEKLIPGTYWVVDVSTGDIEKTRYWSLANIAERAADQRTNRFDPDEFLESIKEAVSLHSRSDVPVGLFLSGGLDSGIVAMVMRLLLPDRDIRTFSLGFEKGKNELLDARQVASRINAQHHEVMMSENSIKETLDILARTYGDPMADSSAAPYYMLSRYVSRHVKVALGGDGGDELYMGYKWYFPWMKMAALPRISILNIIAETSLLANRSNLNTLFKAMSVAGQERLDILHGYAFSHKEVSGMLSMKSMFAEGYYSNLPVDLRARLYDLLTFTVDDILYKIDGASMAHSIEARVPLLDHKLLESALHLPPQYLMRNTQGKICLRNAFAKLFPQKKLTKKSGFGAPLKDWEIKLLAIAHDQLPKGRMVNAGIISYEPVKQLLDQYTWRRASKLWILLILENWLRVREGWR